MLKGKHIILGITGSIAAYKAALLARLLVKEGAEVQVVMTALAKEFITPLTMATLTKKPILVDFYNPENGDWNSHVDLGLWADLMLIAPATTYLSAKCPVVVAPAMDLDMYRHSATQRNLAVLRSFGNVIIEPEDGELASGLTGKGRMEEPENIVRLLERYFTVQAEFAGKKVLITAGPTYEKIDPVRFIGNYSTGKMGFALAEEFARRGAEVVLVAGPVTLTTGHPSIRRVDVESAAEMYAEVIPAAADCDIIVSCAAVADFTPEEKAVSKIKREGENLCLKLQPTQDIAAELGKRKKEGQLLVGFALETDDEQCNAFQKLKKKNLDLIVLNSLKDEGAGFGGDTNKVTMIDRREHIQEYALKSKREVACDIVGRVKNLLF